MFIAYQIRGEDTVTIKTGNKEIDITVRVKEANRNTLQEILNLDIPSPTSGTIKLKQIAELKAVEGPAEITKENRTKKISVGFNLYNIDMGRAVEKINEAAGKYNFPSGVTYK